MLRKVLACFTMVCCLGMLAGCEPPTAKDGSGKPTVESKDAGKTKSGDKKSSKDKRKKKPPHVTTAK